MTRVMLAAFVALLLTFSSDASALTIKLATLAPEGSTWHKALRKLADDWSEITNGEVELKIYAGGVVGNETVMLRKMRIGQLHAGAVTNLGLMEIDPSSQVLNTPMLIRTYDELDHVLAAVKPEFEQRLETNGYKVLGWTDAGWARLFSKSPITSPDKRGSAKIFVWEGDPAAVEMYQTAGFKPVVVAATDVIPSLQSGLIDAFPSTPLAALAFQWFGLAPNMLDVPWAPLLGATIITQDAWNAIPAKYHEALDAAAQRNAAAISGEVRRQDVKAIDVMKRYGLTVTTVDAASLARWEEIAALTHPVVRAKWVTPELFDKVKGLVEEHRAANP